MIQVFIYDELGFFKSSGFVDELKENMTTIPILVGCVKAKFDTKLNEWVEGATQEEIKEWESKQPVSEPTEVEVLRTKLDFATKQLEQQEELIVELAMKVYQ